MNKIDLRNMSADEMNLWVQELGEPKFRGKQIFEWVSKGVETFENMNNLPSALKEKLKVSSYADNCEIVELKESSDGTMKALNRFKDGELAESVFMTYRHGHSVCISTQVGCKMGCTFCASSLHGVVRSLTAGEMLGQIYAFQNKLKKRVSHVVLMGSGEPLDNFDASLKFIKMAIHENGLGISGRHITLSTCGLPNEIRKLADEKLQITLAISLHNPFDSERLEIMPITKKHSISSVLEAVDYYIERTNRRVTFEYALISGVNDGVNHAERLGELLRGKLIHVNLIPVNPVVERGYSATNNAHIMKFKSILEKKFKIETTVRRELGSDINAACGQLRNEKVKLL